MKGDPHKSLQASPEQFVYAGNIRKGHVSWLAPNPCHFCSLCSE